MKKQSEAEIVRAAVAFVLGHYERPGSASAFAITPVDPETWWSKVQLLPHRPADLLPGSRAHFEARLARWQELAVAALVQP